MAESNVTSINVARRRQSKKKTPKKEQNHHGARQGTDQPPPKPPMERYAILDCKIPNTARYLYQYFQSNAADYMPSQRTIMKHTALTPPTIVTAKKFLVSHNMIVIKKIESSRGAIKDLIYINDHDKWTDMTWLNPRTGNKKAVQKAHRLSGLKSTPLSGLKSTPYKLKSSKLKTKLVEDTTNNLTTSGQNETPKMTPIEILRAFNPITGNEPPKIKNWHIRPVLDLYDSNVILAFIEFCKVRKWYGKNRKWENFQKDIPVWIELIYKKNDPAEN